MATDSIRWIIGMACLAFALAIFGSWLPRWIAWMLKLPRGGFAQKAGMLVFALLPVLVGLGPLVVLIALIRNPITYVSETGVTKENVFSGTSVSLTWADIAHVSCGSGRGSGPRWFTLTATDGRKIGLGNPGGFDFAALHVFFEDQLGLMKMQGCPKAIRHPISRGPTDLPSTGIPVDPR